MSEENLKALGCNNCSTLVHPKNIYCPNCQFPQFGTQQERRDFRMAQSKKYDAISNAEGSSGLLFFIGGIISLFSLIGIVTTKQNLLFIDLGLGLVFIGLGIWTKKGNPFWPLVIGATLYSLLFLLGILVGQESPVSIIIKLAITFGLLRGVYYARQIREEARSKNIPDDILDLN